MVTCGTCDGIGSVTYDHPGNPFARMRRCPDYCEEGLVVAHCWCGDVAVALVADSEPVCAVCAEDYTQGPVSIEGVPWQTETN